VLKIVKKVLPPPKKKMKNIMKAAGRLNKKREINP